MRWLSAIAFIVLLSRAVESFTNHNLKSKALKLPRHIKFPRKIPVLSMAIIGPIRYSTRDWLDCIKTLPSSRILKRTKFNILFFTAFSSLVTYMYKANIISVSLPASVHSIAGSALTLLLVFRTNASYDRFWEGRKCLASIVMAARDIARHTRVHLKRKWFWKIASYLALYSILLKQHVQGERNDAEVVPFFKPNEAWQSLNTSFESEVKEVQKYKNRPLQILLKLEMLIHHAIYEQYTNGQEAVLHEKTFMDSFHTLSSNLANCERLVKQPVPLAYSRHLSRFLSLYMLTLPLSLANTLGWLTVPVVALLCWSFVSIQEIGHYIEEPFNKNTQIIPMNQISTVVISDVSDILENVLATPDIIEMENNMMIEAKRDSRLVTETFFQTY